MAYFWYTVFTKYMAIQVIGSGCPKCKKLFDQTSKAIVELGLGIKVEYIADVQKILDMGLMSSPVVAIDGKPILVGQVPEVSELKQIIQDNLKKETI